MSGWAGDLGAGSVHCFLKALRTWLSRNLRVARIALSVLLALYRAKRGTATGFPTPTTGMWVDANGPTSALSSGAAAATPPAGAAARILRAEICACADYARLYAQLGARSIAISMETTRHWVISMFPQLHLDPPSVLRPAVYITATPRMACCVHYYVVLPRSRKYNQGARARDLMGLRGG
jgi:hypothetical protein